MIKEPASREAAKDIEPAPETRIARTDWGKVRDILLSTVLALLLMAALGFAAAHVARIILIIVAAALVAYLASPAVTMLDRFISRIAAALIVYLVFLGLIIGAAAWLVNHFIPQITQLVENFPSEISRLQAYLAQKEQQFGHPGVISSQLDALKNAFSGGSIPGLAGAGAGGVASTSLRVVGTVTDTITNIVLVLVISLYFVLDGAHFWTGARALVPTKHANKVAFVEMQLNRIIGGYIRGQLTLSLIIGASVGVGMLLLGVNFAVVLGVAGFFFELIPMIGPVLIGILCIIVAAFQGFQLVIEVLVFYIVLQLVESNVLGPRISGHAVGLHPAAAIIALITGAELFGLAGALVAVPVAGLAFVVIAATVKYIRGETLDSLVEPRKRWNLPRRRPLRPSQPSSASG